MKTKIVNSKGTKAINSGDKAFDTFNMIFWIITLLIIMYPLYLILISSISDPDAVLGGRVTLIPIGISFGGYGDIFASKELMRSYANSIFYTLTATTFSILFTMMGAYALSRKFAGKKVVTFFIIFTMFFSGGLIPSYLINRALGLYNNFLIMIIFGMVSVWNLMVARTYIISNIPGEMYEAAVIDGANHFTYFIRIVLPLSGVIMAVLSVYYGIAKWNDYFTALVYIRDRSLLPLQTILRELIATLNSNASAMLGADTMDGLDVADAMRKAEVAKYCAITVSTVPAVVLYVFMQKYFVKGVMIGSLKG